MCTHTPSCPPASAPDHRAARITASHWEQGWCLLCNGVVVFDDGGELVPDTSVLRSPAPSAPRQRQALAA